MKDAKTIVIKLGGHAMDDSELLAAFLRDLAFLKTRGHKMALVHGGGPHITELLKSLGIESHFKNGLRVTDDAALTAVEMALCAKVNKDIVRRMQSLGIKTAGISGQDGQMLMAECKDPELGNVGEITKANPELIHVLLGADFTPVIAPMATDARGNALNINADTSAGAIAGAMNADIFILVSDVPGVLDANGNLLAELDSQNIRKLREEGVISGGMIPKTECCLKALASGCKMALILDGRRPDSLARAIEQNETAGTAIRV